MPIIIFLVLAFAISWAIAYALYAAGGFAGAGAMAGLYLTAMMFGPSIAAIVTALIYDRSRFAAALGLTGYPILRILKWLPLAWLAPIVLVALAALIAGLAGNGFANPVETLGSQIEQALAAQGQESPMPVETLVMLQLAVGVPVGILINTILLTISEEIGWRGWLQPRLMGLGFWPMCLVSGIIWGVWHAPIIVMGYNYPGEPVLGPILMVIFCILLTPYVALLRERAAVYAAGAFHGSINAVAGVSLLFLADPGGWVWGGIMGLGGFITLAAGGVVIYFWRKANPPAPVPVKETPADDQAASSST